MPCAGRGGAGGAAAPLSKATSASVGLRSMGYFGFRPFSAKYFCAPGCQGMGEPTSYCFVRSRFDASEWTACRSALCSNMSDAGGPYARLLEQYFEAAQIPPPRTQSLGNVEGVKRGILAGGAALGLLPAHAVERELREGTLTAVEVHPALPPLVLRALVAPGAVESPLVEDLIQSLRGLALGA